MMVVACVFLHAGVYPDAAVASTHTADKNWEMEMKMEVERWMKILAPLHSYVRVLLGGMARRQGSCRVGQRCWACPPRGEE